MLTPFFQLQQNDIYLIVKIRAPYCKLSDAEVTYGDREFVFNATPYFLRLFLTGDVIDDETGTCEYDSEKESLFATQKLCSPTDNVLIENNKFGYGFGWLRNEVLGKFKEEIADLIDLDDPENILIEERNQKLKEFDEKHFSEQYYLADLFSQEQYQNEAMQFYLDKKYLILAEEDCSDLKDLRIRKLEKFTKEINEKIALSLVDIIFGFAYDFRTTLGEHSVESGWTISKLSPSLTFLVKWSNMQEAMSSTIRHSLVLPMIRNWELSLKVLHDVQTIIENGCSSILHVLLTTRRIFNRSGEFRYLLNQLFIDDLCLWIQSIDEELILNLNKEFKNVLKKLNKSDILELDLEFIEAQAKLQMLKPVDSDDE